MSYRYKIGEHLQEINSINHGLVVKYIDKLKNENWYLLESDEMELVNHWVPESKLELHKEELIDIKLEPILDEQS